VKRYYLPVGLIIAIIAALVYPTPGTACKNAGLVAWAVIIIFLVSGYKISLKDLGVNRRFVMVFLCAAGINLVLASFLARYTALLLPDPMLRLGLVVMATVPATLSSCVVITGIAGGSVVWALLLTVGLNSLGILTIPWLLQINLSATAQVEVSAMAMLQKLVLRVLLPLVVGHMLRYLPKRFSGRWLGYVPSTFVILAVWMALSKDHHALRTASAQYLLLTAAAALWLHLVLMLLARGVSRLLRLSVSEYLPFLFVTSQKTLPIALTVLIALERELPPAADIGLPIMVCIVFHFLQLMVDSGLAACISRRSPATATVSA